MWPHNLWFITNLQTPIVLFRFISKAFWLMEFLYTIEQLLNSIWHCARILILRRGPVSNSRLTFNSLHLKFLIKSRNNLGKIGLSLTNLQCQYIMVHFPQNFSGVAVLKAIKGLYYLSKVKHSSPQMIVPHLANVIGKWVPMYQMEVFLRPIIGWKGNISNTTFHFASFKLLLFPCKWRRRRRLLYLTSSLSILHPIKMF